MDRTLESPDKSASVVLNLSREGFRTQRDNFPSAQSETFNLDRWSERRELLAAVISGTRPENDLSINGRVITTDHYRRYGLIILDTIGDLAQQNDGIRPTFYQVVASLSKHPDVGAVGSPELEIVIRMLHARWFSGREDSESMWSGGSKNLYDGLTIRFPSDAADFAGLTLAQVVVATFAEKRGLLIPTTELVSRISPIEEGRRATGLIAPILQLLSQAGQIIRHPDQVSISGERSSMVAVWSDNSGQWAKPEILNPELSVISHAADRKWGWMFDLYANTGGSKSIFNHHTIIAAARRLDERGLVHLSEEYMPESADRPNGDRAYSRVQLTDYGAALAIPWLEVPVGGIIDDKNYEPLRFNLVNRPKI